MKRELPVYNFYLGNYESQDWDYNKKIKMKQEYHWATYGEHVEEWHVIL